VVVSWLGPINSDNGSAMRTVALLLLSLTLSSLPFSSSIGQDTLRLPDYLGTICITPNTTCDVPPSPLYSTCFCSGDIGGVGQVH